MNRARAWRFTEVGLALLLLAGLLALRGPVHLGVALSGTVARGIGSFFVLLGQDPSGVLASAGLLALRALFIVAPLARWMARWPRHRFVWLPHLLLVILPLFGTSVAGVSTTAMWLLLGGCGVIAFLAAGRKWLGGFALVPLLVAGEPALAHSPLADGIWTPARLAGRCARNDGVRPRGFTPQLAGPRHYAVTRLDDDLALLTGDRHDQWLARGPDGTWAFEKPSAVHGNLWQGCVLGRSIWLVKRHRFFQVERLAGGERVSETASPDPPGITEYDFAEPACDAAKQRVFATELVSGGVRELSLRDGAIKRHQLSGFNLQFMLRKDGLMVGIDTARLMVFDPDKGDLKHTRAAGLGLMGIDVCAADDAVVVADMTGRVRLFERGPAGDYVLRASRFVSAPRRIVFSPDCQVIAATSADDRSVYALRRSDLSQIRRFSVGPSLRDIAFTGPREVAVADACSATFLQVGP